MLLEINIARMNMLLETNVGINMLLEINISNKLMHLEINML